MQSMESTSRSFTILSAIFLLSMFAGTLSAQIPAPTPYPIPEQSPRSSEDNSLRYQPAAPALQQTQTNNNELAPVYGLQGVLIETLDGKTLSAQAVDQGFNPASS